MKNKYNSILLKKEQEKEKSEKMQQVRVEIKKQLAHNISEKKSNVRVKECLYKAIWICIVLIAILILLSLLYNEFPEQYKMLLEFPGCIKNILHKIEVMIA